MFFAVGAEEVKKRLRAWRRHFSADLGRDTPFVLLQTPVNLGMLVDPGAGQKRSSRALLDYTRAVQRRQPSEADVMKATRRLDAISDVRASWTLGSLEPTGNLFLASHPASPSKQAVYLAQMNVRALLGKSEVFSEYPRLRANLIELSSLRCSHANVGWVEFEAYLAAFEAGKLTLAHAEEHCRNKGAAVTLGGHYGLGPEEVALGPPHLRWRIEPRLRDVPLMRIKEKFPGFDLPSSESPARMAKRCVTMLDGGDSWDSGAVFVNGDKAPACDIFTMVNAYDPDAGVDFQLLLLGQMKRTKDALTPAERAAELAKVRSLHLHLFFFISLPPRDLASGFLLSSERFAASSVYKSADAGRA